LQRKIEEQYRAIQLEKDWTKNEILEKYLNMVPLSGQIYGVKSAALEFFDKDISEGDELTLAECAILAGITKSTGAYSPYTEDGRNNILQRKDVVLGLMLDQNYITESQYNEAKNEKVKFTIIKEMEQRKKAGSKNTYFVDSLIRQLQKDISEKENITTILAQDKLYKGGYKVYTTFDPKVQKAIDKVFQDKSYFDDAYGGKCKSNIKVNGKSVYNKPYNLQASMVVMDTKGYVRGLYGGKGKKTQDLGTNYATDSGNRNPGSSIKPILIYGPALNMEKITAATVLDDSPTYENIGGETKRYPNNVTNDYKGLISVRYALKVSNNIAASKVWHNYADRKNALEFLDKLGFSKNDTSQANENPASTSIALGAAVKANTYQMAGAYMPFANKGNYLEPSMYTKILDVEDKVFIDKTKGETKRKSVKIYSEENAYIMTDILKDVVDPQGGGTAHGFVVRNSNGQSIATAGKTGTTQYEIDRWFVGYTPYYIGSVWFGDEKNLPLPKMKHGKYPQLAIWGDVMNAIHKNLQPKDFAPAPGVVTRQVCKYSGDIPTSLCSQDAEGNAIISEIFSRNNTPNKTCQTHVSVKICLEGTKKTGYPVRARAGCPINGVVDKVLRDRSSAINYILQRKASDLYLPSVLMKAYTAPWKDCELHSDNPDDATMISLSPIISGSLLPTNPNSPGNSPTFSGWKPSNSPTTSGEISPSPSLSPTDSTEPTNENGKPRNP